MNNSAWQNIKTAESEFLVKLADEGGLAPLVAVMLRHCAKLLSPNAPTETFIQHVPDKCDRIIWRGAYYQLSLIDDNVRRFNFIEDNRVAVTPEFEGAWHAEIYGEDEKPKSAETGSTAREAIDRLARQLG